MLPVEKGRYCNACAKTVIDFSVLSDAEIQAYFVEHFSEQICGHFKASQLQRIVIELPHDAVRFDQPFWKRFLVICLLIFGTTVFPFEAVMAGIQTEQTQQALHSTNPEKTHKKPRIAKRKKLRTRYFKLDKFELNITFKDFTLLGFTTTHEKPVCRPGEPVAMPKDSSSNPAYKSQPAPAEKEDKESGSTPKPPFESLFILPQSIEVKKQLTKTT